MSSKSQNPHSPQIEAFLKAGLYLKNWSPRTASTYRTALASLAGIELSKAGLQGWIVGMREKGLTPGGCNVYIRTVNSFLSYLREEGTDDVPKPLKLMRAPLSVKVILTGQEIRLLTAYRPSNRIGKRSQALVLLLIDTGMRIDEALKLRVEDISWDSLVLKVHGKGGKERLIPFSLEARKNLWKLGRDLKGTLFQTSSGLPLAYRNCYREIQDFVRAAGLKRSVHPHLLRHTFAARYLTAGGDLYRLSRMLGHTSLTTTALYLRGIGAEDLRLKVS